MKDRGNPGSVVGSLFQDLKQFADGADQSDDITMLNVWTGGISGVSGETRWRKQSPPAWSTWKSCPGRGPLYGGQRLHRHTGQDRDRAEEIFTNIASYAYGKEAGELT